MRKQFEINGVGVNFESNALTPRLYKKETGRDFFGDIFKTIDVAVGLDPKNPKKMLKAFASFDSEALTDICYVMAMTANKVDGEKTPTIEEWLIQYKDFNIFDEGIQLLEAAGQEIQPKKK